MARDGRCRHGSGGRMRRACHGECRATVVDHIHHHGQLFYYIQNNALDARNFFRATTLPNHYHNFGGSIGGPIKKDKTFFFVNLLWMRQFQTTQEIDTVPSLAQRAGDADRQRDSSRHPTARRHDREGRRARRPQRRLRGRRELPLAAASPGPGRLHAHTVPHGLGGAVLRRRDDRERPPRRARRVRGTRARRLAGGRELEAAAPGADPRAG